MTDAYGREPYPTRVHGFAFDLEGTVINVEPAHHGAHFATAAEVGVMLTIDTAFQLLPHFIGGPDIEVMRDIWELSDKQVPPEELLRRKQEHYERLLKTMDIAPRPGFVEFLREVWHLGLEVSIGSLTPSSQARVLLARSGVGRLIGEKNIVLAEDVKNHKPAPDVFLRTAALMGIQAQYQIVFEDSPRGVQAAIAAGSRAIGMPVYPLKRTAAALVDAGVCRIFCDWREINVAALLANLCG